MDAIDFIKQMERMLRAGSIKIIDNKVYKCPHVCNTSCTDDNHDLDSRGCYRYE